jgi:signal transduction histidine kinase
MNQAPDTLEKLPSRRLWLPYCVLSVCLAATAAAAWAVHSISRAQDQARFNAAVERTRIAIANRIDIYSATLRNVTALFQTGGLPSRAQFSEYLSRLEIDKRYPGILGIGFSLRVPAADREKVAQIGREHILPGFRIWPEEPPRQEYHTIYYLEPMEERNLRAMGYDMHTEPVRAAAMDSARDTGKPVASGRVELVQEANDADRQPGFLIYMPLFRGKTPPATPQQRREALIGHIYAPFRADDLFRGIFQHDPYSNIDFRLYDGHAAETHALLHDSSRFRTAQEPARWPLTVRHTITVAERPWTIEFVTRRAFEHASSRWMTPLILAVGAVVSATFFAITRSQVLALLAQRRTLAELERSRDELHQAKEAAEAASRTKDEFLAVVSHELRTPLTPVLLTVSLLESHPGMPEELREEVAAIRRNVELESRLISDLLDLMRVARGKLRLEMSDVDVHAAVRSAVDICQREASVKLSVELRAMRHTVRGDPTRLQQVFWNLISNAQKFTGTDGTITVRSMNVEGSRIRIEVSDTGVGIDPQVLPRLFNAFEQGQVRARRQQAGLGLGLAICRRLTEAHGGTITATSPGPGRGATFTVELPAYESALKGKAERRPPAPPASRPLNLLLVEDHEPTLAALTRLLRGRGHRVTGATSVASAAAAVRREGFDLIISDLGLPDGSGLDVMRQLRAQYGGKAIALTGYGMDSDVRASREAGFAEHLTKPVDPAVLEATIGRLAGEK